MIRHIIYFEWKNIKSNKAIIWIASIFFLLMLFSTYDGYQNIKRQKENITKFRKEEKEKFENLLADIDKVDSGVKKVNVYNNPKTPYLVGGKLASHKLIKEPGGLSLISIGQSDFFPYHYNISLRNKHLYSFLMGDDKMENPVNQLYGHFDLAFVLIWLLPLFVIAFSYNILSSEREQGTLKLLKAQSVSITKVLIVKALLRFVIIIGLTIASIGISLSLFGVNIIDNIISIVNLLSIICVYVLFWFLVSVLINLFDKNSGINAGILFTIWLILILIAPTLLNIVSNYKYPVPSRIELVNIIREATYEIDNNTNKILGEYFFDHPELVSMKSEKSMADWVYKNTLKNMIAKTASDSIVKQYKSQYNKQIGYINHWKYFSPAIILQQALDKLSGNSTKDFLKFQTKADEYNDKWRMYFSDKIFKDELLSKNDILDLPKYSYQSKTGTNIITYILYILAYCGIAGGLIFFISLIL